LAAAASASVDENEIGILIYDKMFNKKKRNHEGFAIYMDVEVL
jgi:hypothetical protein